MGFLQAGGKTMDTMGLSVASLVAGAAALGLVACCVIIFVQQRRLRRFQQHRVAANAHHHSLAGKLQAVRQELDGNEDRYWMHLRSTAAPVLIYTPEGEIVAASKQMLEILGYQTEAELTRVHTHDLYADIRERDLKLMAELREVGEIRNGRFRLKKRDGTAIHTLGSIRVHTTKDGAKFHEVVLADITSLIEAAEQREKLQSQLGFARRLEAIGQLAAGIAHELNTPIQFIGDNVHFLKTAFGRIWPAPATEKNNQGATNARQVKADQALAQLHTDVTQAFDAAHDGIQRVTEIVRAMKEFAHPGDAERCSSDLNQIVRSALIVARNEYKYLATAETNFAELPPVDCHKGEISKVLVNLIVNAAHAIESAAQGGRPSPGTITVRTWRDSSQVYISIADTGCGIPATVLPRIFDPFFTTKPVGRGTGQGLAIAREIVQRHDGHLEVESTVGVGTVFTICLPLTKAGAESPAADDAAEPPFSADAMIG
jgi:PAS domain S-box-containing protein